MVFQKSLCTVTDRLLLYQHRHRVQWHSQEMFERTFIHAFKVIAYMSLNLYHRSNIMTSDNDVIDVTRYQIQFFFSTYLVKTGVTNFST